MRDFFINAFEKLVGLVIIVMGIGVVIASLAAMFGGMGPGGTPGNIFAGLMILVSGAVYILAIGGVMYLGLGIYQNTRRMADLLESRSERL